MRITFIILSCFLLLACNNFSPETANTTDTNSAILKSVINSNQWRMDSLEFIYYPEPSNQKKFKNIIVTDSSFLNDLQLNLLNTNGSFNECPHYIKMFLFKEGEVFKTVYISDTCQYLAFAQNSNPQFIKLQDLLKQKIDSLKILLQ